MREACSLVWSVLVLLFQPRASLGAEILILRHQLNIQRRHLPKRLTFSAMDRLIFVGLYRLAPSTLNALTIVKPEPVVRWHRAGFRLYWCWKSRRHGWPADGTAGNTPAHPGNEHRKSTLGSCVKKTRERHAVRKMKEDPSEPSCRGRLQTAISCFGQKPRW